jgi:signal transduction histidine kinase
MTRQQGDAIRQSGRTFEVPRRPAGIGYDVRRTPMGSGQRNMADRLAALDGRMEVASVPSKGTTITAYLPLPAGPAESIASGAPFDSACEDVRTHA